MMVYTDNQIIKPAETAALPPYVYYEQLYSPPECQRLIKIGEGREHHPGTVGNATNHSYSHDPSYRCVQTCSITPNDSPWFFTRLKERIEWTNRDCFRFDLSGFFESAVWLKYTMGDGDTPAGHYKWHQDYGGGYSSLRKLSVVVQLSDPEEYEGCRLRLFTNKDFDPGHVKQGDVMIFPSYLPHMVTPLTKGLRYSMAVWVSGPPFR